VVLAIRTALRMCEPVGQAFAGADAEPAVVGRESACAIELCFESDLRPGRIPAFEGKTA
jgi:hypothetical protein